MFLVTEGLSVARARKCIHAHVRRQCRYMSAHTVQCKHTYSICVIMQTCTYMHFYPYFCVYLYKQEAMRSLQQHQFHSDTEFSLPLPLPTGDSPSLIERRVGISLPGFSYSPWNVLHSAPFLQRHIQAWALLSHEPSQNNTLSAKAPTQHPGCSLRSLFHVRLQRLI